MAHRDGQRIGGIGRIGGAARQQHADHGADLALVGMAGSDQGFLDDVGRVFGDRDAGLGRRQHDDAARLAELERRCRVAIGEGFLDRRFVGREVHHDAVQRGV